MPCFSLESTEQRHIRTRITACPFGYIGRLFQNLSPITLTSRIWTEIQVQLAGTAREQRACRYFGRYWVDKPQFHDKNKAHAMKRPLTLALAALVGKCRAGAGTRHRRSLGRARPRLPVHPARRCARWLPQRHAGGRRPHAARCAGLPGRARRMALPQHLIRRRPKARSAKPAKMMVLRPGLPHVCPQERYFPACARAPTH